MALRQRSAVVDAYEGEALLNDPTLWTSDDAASSLTESMTARVKTSWSGEKSLADTSGDGTEFALESIRDPHDLDNAHLRAQGHEAALERSFSPLAAVGLGFRYSFMISNILSSTK